MKAFGIEVRRADNVTSLYRDVDLVLSKHGLQDGGISAELQRQAIAHALQKMMKADSWFNV
jgi:hypothetical protein